MGKHKDRVCGADVHKDLIVATITDRDGSYLQESFGTSPPELERFKEWLKINNCEQVAFEATGVYWLPVHEVTSQSIDTIVANPYQIKSLPNDKSDAKDADRIAEYCLNGQIKRSRVFSQEYRDLRTLTRARSGYVRTRTQIKNRIHKHLSSNGIKLSSCIEDIFGKSGRYILDGLAHKRKTSDIITGIPSGQIRKKSDLIGVSINNGLDETSRTIVKDLLELLDITESKIEKTANMVANKMLTKSEDLAIVMSIPGLGFTAGTTILSEIGDIRDFKTPESMANWGGLIPGSYESAGKKRSCGITKRGPKQIRTVLVEVAHVIARTGDSRLHRFFQRLRARKNYNVAIVALARKLICLIHHLLTNRELYQENYCEKKKQETSECDVDSSSLTEESLEDRVAAIVDALYHLKDRSRKRIQKKKTAKTHEFKRLPKWLSDGGG